MLKKTLLQRTFNNVSTILLNNVITKTSVKSFSIYNSDKDKKLAQFFKLPSIENLKDDQIFDKSDEQDVSVLDTYDEDIDKVDLMNKVLKKKLYEEERHIKVFFRGNSDRDNIKITENLIERLRLNKEFKFSEDFKKREVLNEYGNYDKYFENYKVVSEKKPDLDDDGTNKWEQKYRELQEKYNNPNSRTKNEKVRRIQLQKMIQDLRTYGSEFTFEDYLNFKERFEEPDYNSTNPRDPSQDNIENVDTNLLDRINNKIDYKQMKEVLFNAPKKDEGVEDLDDNQDENPRDLIDNPKKKNNTPNLSDDHENYNPLVDRDGNPYHSVNLVTGPDEAPLEYNIREMVKKARNVKNKIEELRNMSVEAQEYNRQINTYRDLEYTTDVKNAIARVSPFIKEDIYRAYLEGWAVKDLSYKYGLAPERIKCIVFDRDYFWKHIYPIIGESGLRKRLNGEFEHARRFGMWEYGKDLDLMAEREQGFLVKQITRGDVDAKPTKEHEMDIAAGLANVKVKSKDHITIGFYGKGAKGYAIKEMILKRGLGRKRVSKMFEDYLHLKDKYPHLLPKKVLRLKEYGPRMATLGYRF